MTAHLVERALAVASRAHAGVARKWTGEPYIEHCKRVAGTIAALGFGPEVIAAAYLHDVVEDTEIDAAALAAEFPAEVVALVLEVTKPKRLTGNWKARRAAARAHYAKSSYAGASIKLADMLDNSSNVAKANSGFARVYLPELRKNLAVLGHGHPALLAELTKFLS